MRRKSGRLDPWLRPFVLRATVLGGLAGLLAGSLAGCPAGTNQGSEQKPSQTSAPSVAPVLPVAPTVKAKPVEEATIVALTNELASKHGEAQRERIKKGLTQVASLWTKEDGEFGAFVKAHYLADEKDRDATFARLQEMFEQIDGHLNEVARELRRPTDTDIGPLLAVDPLFAALDPSAHLSEDLFRAKIGFVVLLNFPLSTLAERIEKGKTMTRRQWAEARLAGRFSRRVPAAAQEALAKELAASQLYIAEYNLWLHHLMDADGSRPFPKGLRLISHWNLRDEIKASYSDPKGLVRQRLIAKLMERIVTQTIPQIVIDNPRVDYDPVSGEVRPCPADEVEDNAPKRVTLPSPGKPQREEDTRYERWIANFKAHRAADPYSPNAPTLIKRSFEYSREMPEERVVGLLTEIVSSKLAPQVAVLIEKRLGRKLEPHDLWYNGFQARGKYTEKELDEKTRKLYPTAAAFQGDMQNILVKLGFTKDKARFLSEHIKVDASRGAGHAMESRRRGDFPRLRTRVSMTGMDYKGYNIAVHELGHNVEQVFSLYNVDHTLLQGVPNNAFTEALAFVFQARDLELLGLAKPDAEAERMRVLTDFWATFEISGVALVDTKAWHYLYEHPEASKEEFRNEVVRISKELWNKYYAPILGGQDTVLLGIYSHMIQESLYLPDYPLGHLIAFQIEEHLRKKGRSALGAEFERMASYGSVLPDLWMEHATGAPISAAPLLAATAAALEVKAQK